MKSRKWVRHILTCVFMLLPTLGCIYLIYRIDRLEQTIYDIVEEQQALYYNAVEEQQMAEGEISQTEELSETEAQQDIDSIENQLTWDIETVSANAWDSDVGMHKVYLTFDDGPSNNTDKILDILDEYGVKATFFVVGKDGFEDQYRRIVADGHSLGMHSYSHKYREIYQSLEAYEADLNRIQNFLFEVTGQKCQIVRFPGGSSNSVSRVDMRELIDYLQTRGITYYDWNVSSGDAGKNYISAGQIAGNVLNAVEQYDSAIVLMHDSADRDTTVEALPTIIEKILESENTVLLPISEGTAPIQHIQ